MFLKTGEYINGSYSGRFFDGGYAGITKTKEQTERNYPLEAFRNVCQQIPHIHGIEFHACSYEDLPIPANSIIYCEDMQKIVDANEQLVKGMKDNEIHGK